MCIIPQAAKSFAGPFGTTPLKAEEIFVLSVIPDKNTLHRYDMNSPVTALTKDHHEQARFVPHLLATEPPLLPHAAPHSSLQNETAFRGDTLAKSGNEIQPQGLINIAALDRKAPAFNAPQGSSVFHRSPRTAHMATDSWR